MKDEKQSLGKAYNIGYKVGYSKMEQWHKSIGNTSIQLPNELKAELVDTLSVMPQLYIIGLYEGMDDYRKEVNSASGQARFESFVEACVNTAVGLTITTIATPIANYCFDIEMSNTQMLKHILFFTFISVARGYILRRFFNNLKGVKLFFTKLLKRK